MISPVSLFPRPPRTHKRVCVSCTLGPRGRSKSRQHPPMLAGSAPLELRLYKRLRGEGPSKRPRTGLHRRPCVSAHVCHARARAQQCTTSTTAVQLYCRALAGSVRGFSTMSHLRRRGASLRLASHHVGGHPATRQLAPAHACPVSSAGVPLARASGHPLVSKGPPGPPSLGY